MSIPYLLFLTLVLTYFVVLPPLFKRAGIASWKGYIPLYQYIVWIKLLQRPWWWVILLFTPGVNLIMLIILNVETAIAFEKGNAKEQWLAAVLPWVFLPMLAFKFKTSEFIGPRDKKRQKSMKREWGEAIVFAIVAASVIRAFFMEAFTIPTPSMEGSMLVGDYLFVSKMSYGAKVPNTPLSIPFVHNRIPGTMTRSFVEWFELPYMRLPGFGDVERFDPIVFNFPHGDTVMLNDPLAGHDYYYYLKKEAIFLAGDYESYLKNKEEAYKQARENILEKNIVSCIGAKLEGYDAYPIDKLENYVKRCVGVSGDKLEVIDRVLYINDVAQELPEEGQLKYQVNISSRSDFVKIKKDFELVESEMETYQMRDGRGNIIRVYNGPLRMPLTAKQAIRMAKLPFIKSEVEPVMDLASFPDTNLPVDSLGNKQIENQGLMFPYSDKPKYRRWTVDNFGPIFIPKKGETIELTDDNIDEYRRTITAYEGNELKVMGNGDIFINGEKTNHYTFKYDYYFMMGDNRHASLDSRYWGWVPETHIVGKPVFTWFSKEQMNHHGSTNIRWNRMFHAVD